MFHVWNSFSPPVPTGWPPKKLTKNMNTKSISSFLLPKLDEMVLLQPITTPCDDRDDFKTLVSIEKSRTATISQHLDRYNRWLAFAETSSSEKNVRSTAMDMQQAVHDLNSTIDKIMMELDRKILSLQDNTDAFVAAVQEDLSFEELDTALLKHPQRNTKAQLQRLTAIVRKQADRQEQRTGYTRRCPGKLAGKLIRIIKEVQACPGGSHEAFYLCIFVMVHIFRPWEPRNAFENNDFDIEIRFAESMLLQMANESCRKPLEGMGSESRQFFDFASAKRTVRNSITVACSPCSHRTTYPVNSSLIDPLSSCRRASCLGLVERLQIEAYGEIKSNVMLTLPSLLPKELCFLIFEFVMAAEKVAIDPTVFEYDERTTGGPRTHRSNWTSKMEYRCRESIDEE